MQEENRAAAPEQGKNRRRRRRKKNTDRGTAAAPRPAGEGREQPVTGPEEPEEKPKETPPAPEAGSAGPAVTPAPQPETEQAATKSAPETGVPEPAETAETEKTAEPPQETEQSKQEAPEDPETSETDVSAEESAPEQPKPAETAEPSATESAPETGVAEPAENVEAENTAEPPQETSADQQPETEQSEQEAPEEPETPETGASAEESVPEQPEPAETAEPSATESAPEAEAAETSEPAEQSETEPGEAEESGAEIAAQGEEPAPEDGEGEEELSEEEEKRISDMTRTVQLSIEQIMAQVDEEIPDADAPAEENAEGDDTSDGEEDSAPLATGLQSGLSGIAKWLLLVLFIVLVISGCGVAWLYGNATPDMVPRIEVTFDGQAVEPAAYKWKVPVVGNLFKRTYADTLSSTPVALEETVDQVSPDFTVSPSGYRDELTVTDSTGATVYEGDTKDFAAFRFAANGAYTAELTVYSDASKVPGETTVTGSQTWRFTFTVGIEPSIQLSSEKVTQGSALAVRVGETMDGQPPVLTTKLENPGFFPSGTGWVCYIPIPWNAAAGTQELTVQAGGYTKTFEVEIQAEEWQYKDYYSDSQLTAPYIGTKDLPATVQNLFKTGADTLAWSNSGFVQPFLNSLDVRLAFGTTEYVGRSYSERDTNTGAGGRTATNVVLNTSSGESLIAPADGTVLLAQDLGGDLGYTLVIDHGAGVKSIFYDLRDVSVKKGDTLTQGQKLGTCGRITVAEMRIGTVPIDPVQVWRGQCNALRYY